MQNKNFWHDAHDNKWNWKLLILFKSHIDEYYSPVNLTAWWNFGFILGILLVIQVLAGTLLSMHYIFDILNSYNVITLQNMQNENFIYCIQGSIFGASLEQLKIKIFTKKGVEYMKQDDALSKNAFSNYKEKMVLGTYNLFNPKYKYIRYSLFAISILFTISINLGLNILYFPLLFNFVYLIRMFFLSWLSCSLIAASISEIKVLWTCWLQYKKASRLLVFDGPTVTTAGIKTAKAAMSFIFKVALIAVIVCVGRLFTGLLVVDPIAERLGCEKLCIELVGRFTPFVQKHGPEWIKDPSSPYYVPKHKRN